jgi:transposase
MAEAIFYLVRSGCAWRMLPSSFPPWPTVFAHFRRWRLDGTLRRMHDRLRALAREAEGRQAEPSAATIDSQTVRATGVGGPARGYDAAKRTAGRKRHILVDAAGLVLLAHVHAADLHDRLGAQALIGRAGPGEFRASSWSGPMGPTPAPSRAGCKPSAAGVSRCQSIAVAISGATVWKRNGPAPPERTPLIG